jgi:hypothetical protein
MLCENWCSIETRATVVDDRAATPNCLGSTIFARNYGTAAVISYILKGIAPPVPPVHCWANKNRMSGGAAPTLKRVGGGRVENMYQEMVYYNRMHVKTRLSQSILSKIDLCQKLWDSCCNFIYFERNSAPRSPSSLLGH